jgi:hypothetical protein
MRIKCEINEGELENDEGRQVPAVFAECSRCHNVTESFGTSSQSILRCLVLMREECPRDERNFYVGEGG